MHAFNSIIEARRLPKGTAEEIERRDMAILAANCRATTVPLTVLTTIPELLDLAFVMTEKGNPNSLSDAGVAGLTALAAGEGAYFNVLINLQGLGDSEDEKTFKKNCLTEAEATIKVVREKAEKIRSLVISRIS